MAPDECSSVSPVFEPLVAVSVEDDGELAAGSERFNNPWKASSAKSRLQRYSSCENKCLTCAVDSCWSFCERLVHEKMGWYCRNSVVCVPDTYFPQCDSKTTITSTSLFLS